MVILNSQIMLNIMWLRFLLEIKPMMVTNKTWMLIKPSKCKEINPRTNSTRVRIRQINSQVKFRISSMTNISHSLNQISKKSELFSQILIQQWYNKKIKWALSNLIKATRIKYTPLWISKSNLLLRHKSLPRCLPIQISM